MSVEEALPEDYEGTAQANPCYFRILFAAVTTGGVLQYKDQTSDNGPFEPAFTHLTNETYVTNRLNASTTQDGFVALLAEQATATDLVYIVENRDAKTPGRFAAAQNLGKPEPLTGFQDTILIKGITARQNVFVTDSGPGNAIWWRFQNPNTVTQETVTIVPPGSETPVEITAPVETPPKEIWSGWKQLDGSLASLTATSNADGRVILMGLNANKVPYMNFQSSDRPFLPEGWEGWTDISDGLTGFDQLISGSGSDALVHIFASIGSKIYMKSQTEVGSSSFSGWVLFASFSSSEPVGSMSLSVASNDGLYLVAQTGTGPDMPIYASYQNQGSDGSKTWSSPQIIGHTDGGSKLTLQPNANMQLSLFALDPATSTASYLSQQTLAHWSAVWTPLGDGLSAIATSDDITPNSG